MQVPSISHPTDRPNFTLVTTPDGDTLWFSYRTVIAFQRGFGPIIVRQNDWSNTTGKHLNYIDGGGVEAKRRRLPGDAFLAAMNNPAQAEYQQMARSV